ncbi:hypothetical protein DT250_24745 [Bacillus sp. AR2-1]|uniref:hypothetical protein n=1 Tax=Bacillus sp. AR2-1 TaxID=2217816 RepID=UPI0011EC1D50|nr:hypothetical protein [Bacillus sp. AR2-1]KAA0760380.1 hypothetical protein DT250_24745 [Bacillus sp. AR2-1]
MRLSSMKEYDNMLFGFFKFSQRKFLEPLQKGNLYMNNFQYFIDLQKSTGEKGMGDIDEVAGIIKDADFTIYKEGTNEEIGKFKAERMNYRYNDFLQYPVFCLFTIESDMLEIIEITDEYIDTEVRFTEEQKEQMVRYFGECALVMPPSIFMQRVEEVFEEQGIIYTDNKVQYSDFDINHGKRIKSYLEGDISLFFQKDRFFEPQREYRFVILNKKVEKNFEINIGDLSDYTRIIDTSDLLNGKYGIRVSRIKR